MHTVVCFFLKSAAKVCIFFEYTKLLCKKLHIRASEASDYYISNEKRVNNLHKCGTNKNNIFEKICGNLLTEKNYLNLIFLPFDSFWSRSKEVMTMVFPFKS